MSAPLPQDFDNPLGAILTDAMPSASCPGQANMNTNDATLRCPHCGKPMQFMQLIRKQGGLPELRTFVCENCGIRRKADTDSDGRRTAFR
jgi:predicted RNA-binding Zn-ribbon protein involved in translation (DUF1610 family)